jgi:hemerythrin-like domain-containing protein
MMNGIGVLDETRRGFLWRGGLMAAATLLPATLPAQPQTPKTGPASERETKPESEAEQISPAEDLMREHGALSRILLIYDEACLRLGHGQEFPAEVLASAAGLVRRFVEDYHEKLEEDYLFPRFEKQGKLTDLVKVLRQQHQAGRRLTAGIIALSSPAAFKEEAQRKRLIESLTQFNRMYRPHKAREDTVLFPAFRGVVTPRELGELGEQFEQREDQLFGEKGFEKIVGQVAELETQVGLFDLARFTPQV